MHSSIHEYTQNEQQKSKPKAPLFLILRLILRLVAQLML